VSTESITFLLAILGYAGLAAIAIFAASSKYWKSANVAVIVPIVFHVYLVWAYRYQWRISEATRNGPLGFIVFHAALMIIIATPFLSVRRALGLLIISFLTVSVGAFGAVFRYPVVEIYRIPVITLAICSTAYIGYKLLRDRKDRQCPS
jgi:hypothetical protein